MSNSYANDFQVLCALITHLGAHEKWQSRTPSEIAGSLAMNRSKIERILGDYPGFFRESQNKKNGERCFTVHLRYARRKINATTGAHESLPMSPDEIGMLIGTLAQLVSIEKEENRFLVELKSNSRKQAVTNVIAITAAVLAAVSVLIAAIIKGGS